MTLYGKFLGGEKNKGQGKRNFCSGNVALAGWAERGSYYLPSFKGCFPGGGGDADGGHLQAKTQVLTSGTAAGLSL